MTVTNQIARYRELDGRDSMARASIWQGNAGTLFGNNVVYADPGATFSAGTPTRAKTVNTVAYTVGGSLFSKTATDPLWTLGVAGSNTTVPISSFQKYALCIDDAGVATVQEATPSTVSAAAVTWQNVTAMAKANPQNLWAPLISILNASRCIFAIATVATDATHTFIPGATAFNAAGITTTFLGSIDTSLNPILGNERGLIAGLNF